MMSLSSASLWRIRPLRRIRLAVALLAIAPAGCALENRISMAPGATRDSLVFLIGAPAGSPNISVVYGLTVEQCTGGHVVWTIVGNGSRTLPDQVQYGAIVPGFGATVGPEPIGPGC